ncbi:MAG TPA: alpha/beta fold hydrolase [Xanthobacteraceae bacterium]|jgi:alpha-beta hydrolase superfamily lysophospholipase|nr:alpha/beta fold hydrolase [Xanthobacteraceae bacterium]
MSQSRRTIIQSIGAGVVTQLAASEAHEQGEAKAEGEFWRGEYWANKGDVKLAMYRKRVSAPQAGEPALPVLFLVHGSSISAGPSFDLTVPGRGEYSVMNAFARWGFDVWTMDHENYGRSSRTSGNSDIASGVEDLKVGVEVVARETGRAKVHMMGESSGAIRAGAYAMTRPDRVDRLVLSAFTYKGTGSPTLAKRAEQLAYFRSHNMRLRDRAMILSIATRDKPGTSEIETMNALADAELKFGDQCPTGTYLDMTANLPLVDPKKVHSPVMLLRGEHDGIATIDDLIDFFKDLPNGDRQFVILPGVAHSVILATNRQLFWHAVHDFLTMSAPVAT